LHRGNPTIMGNMPASFFDILHRYVAVLWHLYTLRVALTRAIEFVLCARTWHTRPSMHNRNGLFSLTYLTNQLSHFFLLFFTSHPVATGVVSDGAGSVISFINPIAPSVQEHPGPILQLPAVFWHSTSSATSRAAASSAQRSIRASICLLSDSETVDPSRSILSFFRPLIILVWEPDRPIQFRQMSWEKARKAARTTL